MIAFLTELTFAEYVFWWLTIGVILNLINAVIEYSIFREFTVKVIDIPYLMLATLVWPIILLYFVSLLWSLVVVFAETLDVDGETTIIQIGKRK